MASTQHAAPVTPPTAETLTPTGQLARTLSGFDAAPAIDARESNLADYLNQPVHALMGRLGLPAPPQAAPPPDQPDPNAGPGAGAGSQVPGMLAGLLTQMIQPVTDALGMLGPGMFEGLDPTQMFGGISQAFEAASQPVQQALSEIDGVWQGAAASAASAKTSAALADGTQVANQATALGASLSTAAANVQQAGAQLVAIANEFFATIAAIGPNIIFPWGIAEAIAAANHAVTMAAEVMTELQGSLAAEAANVTAIGAPVSVTSAPQTGGELAATGASTTAGSHLAANFAAAPAATASAPAAAAGAPAAVASAPASAFAPMMLQAVAMPAMSGISAATGALQGGGAGGAPAPSASAPGAGHAAGGGPGAAGKAGIGGGAGAGVAGALPETIESRVAGPLAPGSDTAPAAIATDAAAPAAMGGAPIMGGAPMGLGARAGASKSHSAAAFLHTSDQGDEIVGDLGSVAPSVIGELDTVTGPDIELRI
ncbi:hypothetical protein [Mycobacterium sp. 050134]|uniref:hypothetical protein n=1 Tax=Mycobacterium sp. 050134 TaxID=3096111 RepID=UPI002EDAF4FE